MRVGVVTVAYGDPWDEPALVARRLAGALACTNDVDVLVPDGGTITPQPDGAVRLLRFPASPKDPGRRRAWRQVAFGPDFSEDHPFDCSCVRLRRRREPLPWLVEDQLVQAEGGDAPELYSHLRRTPYDLVVFVGLHSPATHRGAEVLPDDRRMVLVPATTDDEVIRLRIHDPMLDRAERIVVFTEGERAAWAERLGSRQARKVENLRFLVGVNPVARLDGPGDIEGYGPLVVVDDWTRRDPSPRLAGWAHRIEREIHADLKLRLVGPGAERSPLGVPVSTSRLDIWRWVCRATMVIDPRPGRLIGSGVLEAFLYRTPAIVHARGGANREHAEAGGGLWFRSDDELCATVRALLDRDLAGVLGDQGRDYAEERFGDTDTFLKRVNETFANEPVR